MQSPAESESAVQMYANFAGMDSSGAWSLGRASAGRLAMQAAPQSAAVGSTQHAATSTGNDSFVTALGLKLPPVAASPRPWVGCGGPAGLPQRRKPSTLGPLAKVDLSAMAPASAAAPHFGTATPARMVEQARRHLASSRGPAARAARHSGMS